MPDSIYQMTHCYLEKGTNQIIRRCVLEDEQAEILDKCLTSSYGGHFAGVRTARNILQSGFY